MAARLPTEINGQVDGSVLDVLPLGCRVISTSPAGPSPWVQTIRVDVQLADGSHQAFFQKEATGAKGFSMMQAAFESEKAVHSFIPEYAPRPISHGSYRSQPYTHFFLVEFVEMDDVHPDPAGWATVVSTLHRRSMAVAPREMFGFHADGYLANVPSSNTKFASWEKFWSHQLRSMCEEEERRRGRSEDFTRLKDIFFDLVIPRFLWPLESDGRTVQACFVHNDLWPGNIKPRKGMPGALCLFDSAGFWGQKVCRPGAWNLELAGEMYVEMMGISEPQSELAVRTELYSVSGLVLRSAMYADDPSRRTLFIEGMQRLIDRVMLAPTLNKLQPCGPEECKTSDLRPLPE